MGPLELSIDIVLPAALWPLGVDSASNRNEYQGYFLGCKGGRCVEPYRLHVSIVLKSWSLNLLEPSGPVQDCTEIALPFNHLPDWL